MHEQQLERVRLPRIEFTSTGGSIIDSGKSFSGSVGGDDSVGVMVKVQQLFVCSSKIGRLMPCL